MNNFYDLIDNSGLDNVKKDKACGIQAGAPENSISQRATRKSAFCRTSTRLNTNPATAEPLPAFFHTRSVTTKYRIFTAEDHQKASESLVDNNRQYMKQGYSDEKLATKALCQSNKILAQSSNSSTSHMLIGLGVATDIIGALVVAMTPFLAVGAVLANTGAIVAGIGLFNQANRQGVPPARDIECTHFYNDQP
tara:strand:- start:1005 stop:1586 length:582 start_codon:yes stop_codon:yes gene_type:complete